MTRNSFSLSARSRERVGALSFSLAPRSGERVGVRGLRG